MKVGMEDGVIVLPKECHEKLHNKKSNKKHRYKWYGYNTSRCEKCGKVLKDEVAEMDNTECENKERKND
jgi:lysyl-tRNA synthetase class I